MSDDTYTPLSQERLGQIAPPVSTSRMMADMLRQFGPPDEGIRRGGIVRRLTILGWSDLYAEAAMEATR